MLPNGTSIAVQKNNKSIKVYYGKNEEQEFRSSEEFRKWARLKFNAELRV